MYTIPKYAAWALNVSLFHIYWILVTSILILWSNIAAALSNTVYNTSATGWFIGIGIIVAISTATYGKKQFYITKT